MTSWIIVTAADAAILRAMRLPAALDRQLERAIVVSSEAVPGDVATMNSLVRYTDETAGVTMNVGLVYAKAPRAAGLVSVLSPLGTALLGRSAGQSIPWAFPDGSERRLRLDEVLYQPERERGAPLARG